MKVLEPVVKEVSPDADASSDKAEPDGVPNSATTPVQALTVLSPTPSLTGSIRVSKRSSSNRRHSGLFSDSYGHKTTIDVVKHQYAIVRHRCQRELGAGVGQHVFDTSHAALLDWIRSERLIRLPHKGGSWDRVLIAAQYFADQVDKLNQAIEPFTAECNAASNLMYGQCLLLLEVSLVL